MAAYLMIQNGLVVNRIVWDGNASNWSPPQDVTVLLDPGSINIGWTYDGSAFAAPAPIQVVPDQISSVQLRMALSRTGSKRAAFQTYLANATQDIQDYWQFSPIFTRSNPNVLLAQIALNVTNSQMDQLFILAATLG